MSGHLGPQRVRVNALVFVKRRSSRLGRLLLDPLHASIRRYFIKEFLESDARLGTKGLRYHPAGLLEVDGDLIRYFEWLASVPVQALDRRWR